MPTPTFTKDVASISRERLFVRVIVLLGSIEVGGGGIALATIGHVVWGPLLVALAVPLAFVALRFGGPLKWRRRGRIHANEAGLWLGSTCVVARNAVRQGWVLRRGERVIAKLEHRTSAPIEVEVSDETEANALLAAMALDPTRTVAEYEMFHGPWPGLWLRVAVYAIAESALIWALSRDGTTLLVSVSLCTVLGVCFLLDGMVRVHAGADGVSVRLRFRRARFLSYATIAAAETDGRELRLRLRDGATVTAHRPARRLRELVQSEDELHALVERINASVTAAGGGGGNVHALLSRGGRGTEQWVRDLAGVTDVNASFRAPALPPSEVWRVLEDPSAPASARAGAAVALRSSIDEAGRTRFRVVADACADDGLREAILELASREEASELGAALDRVTDC